MNTPIPAPFHAPFRAGDIGDTEEERVTNGSCFVCARAFQIIPLNPVIPVVVMAMLQQLQNEVGTNRGSSSTPVDVDMSFIIVLYEKILVRLSHCSSGCADLGE